MSGISFSSNHFIFQLFAQLAFLVWIIAWAILTLIIFSIDGKDVEKVKILNLISELVLPKAKHWVSSYGEEFPAEISSDKFSTASDLPTSTHASTTSKPTQPREEDPASFIESQMPNLPLSYWQDNAKGRGMALNRSCAKMPDLLNLRYNNLYWQAKTKTKNKKQKTKNKSHQSEYASEQ